MSIKISKVLTRCIKPAINCRTVRRFAHNQNGATAVEFGMIAIPFLALMFALIETAIIFFAGQTLETATADSARLIMTGQAQQGTPPLTQSTFKDKVCARVVALFDCAGGIYVDVRKYTAFSAADLSKPVDANGNLINNFVYQPGDPGDIIVVRTIYQWPVHLPMLGPIGFSLADMTGNKRLVMATAVFRNEPYK
jgi:Flp pilus assembly protein TadG